MSTSQKTSYKTLRNYSFVFFGSTLSALAASSSLIGCSHAWEDYEPRLAANAGGSSTSSTGAMSSGGSGGMGGENTGGSGGMGGENTGGSGGGFVKCGGTSVLVSDFSGNTPVDIWNVGEWGGATISETGGELAIVLAANGTGSGAYHISEHYYDFRDDFVSVEATGVTNAGNSAWSYFNVGPDDKNYVEIYQENGSLFFGWEIGDVYLEHKKIPYDAVAHRFWQLRETAGTVYFETSADGKNWTLQDQKPTTDLFAVDFSRITLGAGANDGQANPGVARFDRLSGGGTSKQKYCSISSIRDDFEDGAQDRQWSRSWQDQPGMIVEEGGQLALHYVPNAEAYGGLVSARAFDLTGSSLVVEVPVVPAASLKGNFMIDLNGPGDNDVEMAVVEGSLDFGIDVNGTYQKLGSILHSPVQHRWWRIREQANTLYWETAPDGKTWTTRLEVSPLPVPINMLDVEISGGTWMAQPMPGECRADNVNIVPQ